MLSDQQRLSLDAEAQALFEEYERILNSTEFNGQNLLNGSAGSFTLQAGFGENGELDADIREGETTTGDIVEGLGTYTSNVRAFGSGGALQDGPTFLVGDINNDGIDDIVAIKARQNSGTTVLTEFGFFLGEDGGTSFVLDDTASYSTTFIGVLTRCNDKCFLQRRAW